jgi:hypothetical protein
LPTAPPTSKRWSPSMAWSSWWAPETNGGGCVVSPGCVRVPPGDGHGCVVVTPPCLQMPARWAAVGG